MTTPAQYEAAIRFLEMVQRAYPDFHVEAESALAIVREARERDVNTRGAEAAQALHDHAFNRTEVPDAC